MLKLHRFYASWCKSCAKFGMKYNKLAHDYGDRIRFAEVEYGANAMLCKTLKVRSLPTVHMYKKGKGKVSQMTKRPSEFQDVVDEIDRLLSLDDEVESVEEETYTMNTASNATVDTQFEQTMRDGGNLSIEIMAKIKEQEREEKTKRSTKENSWFTFPFTF
jgi:thioredoxin-like negative regulator of GroEL